MKKGVVGFILFGLVAYGFFLIATVPADRAFEFLRQRYESLGQRVWMSGLEGTIWSGRAAEALIGGVACRGVGWTVEPSGLMVGRLQATVRLQVQDGMMQGAISLGRRDIVVREMKASLPAAFVGEQVYGLTVGLAGDLAARVERLTLKEGRIVEAVGTLVWSGARVTEPEPIRLGDLKADWTSQDGEVRGVLADGGGPLHAQGTITLAPDGTYEFNGAFRARDRAQPALEQTLRLFGRPDRGGAVRVALSGQLPAINL